MSFNPSALNIVTVKKFVDRLEKSYKERGVVVKRTAVQEDISTMLGFQSYHELIQKVGNKTSSKVLENTSQSEKTTPHVMGQAQSVQPIDATKAIQQASKEQLGNEEFLKQQAHNLQTAPWSEVISAARCLYAAVEIAQISKDLVGIAKVFITELMDTQKLSAADRHDLVEILSGKEFAAMKNDYANANLSGYALDDSLRVELATRLEQYRQNQITAKAPTYSVTPFVSKVLNISVEPLATTRSNIDGKTAAETLMQKLTPVLPKFRALPAAQKVAFVHEMQDHYFGPTGLFSKSSNGTHFFDQCDAFKTQFGIRLAKETPVDQRQDLIYAVSGCDRIGVGPFTKNRK